MPNSTSIESLSYGVRRKKRLRFEMKVRVNIFDSLTDRKVILVSIIFWNRKNVFEKIVHDSSVLRILRSELRKQITR